MREAPVIAKWLLRHLSSSPSIEAMVGDLDERYGHGHSRLWYWQQVAVAIVASIFKDIRGHKLYALRALIVGWSVWSILIVFNDSYVGLIGFAIWRHPNLYPLLLTGLYAPFALASGWLVAYLHRQSATTMVLLYAASWWSLHSMLLAQMALARLDFSAFWIPYEATLIGIRMGMDAALVTAIVVGGMMSVHRNSRQIRHTA